MALKAVPKKKKWKKLTPLKVQESFNQAVRERDGKCVSCGKIENLQSSHFFAVKGSGSIRFHPKNAHAQCAGCHIEWHNRNCMPYFRYCNDNIEGFSKIELLKTKTIKHTQELLIEIQNLSKQKEFDKIELLIESRLF